MKFLKNFLPVMCIAFVISFFAGCSLAVPSVTISGFTASWDKVNSASAYEIEIDGETFRTSNTNINLIAYLQDLEIQSFRVRALSSSFFFGSSGFSEAESINLTGPRLAPPQNFIINQNIITENNRYVFSWDAVENATNYCLKFTDSNGKIQYLHTEGTTLDVTYELDGSGEFSANLFAYTNDLENFSPSEYLVADVDFVFRTMLDAPENAAITDRNGRLTYSWNAVSGAESYNVSVLNGKTYTTTSTSYTLPFYPSKGEAVFVSVQAVSGNALYNLDSAYSDMNAYYTNASKTSYTGKNYTFGNKTFDLVADSYEELETIIHFGLYYRIDNINFFGNYSAKYGAFTSEIPNHTNCDVDKALESYVEIKYISYGKGSERALQNAYHMFSIPVEYIHPMHPIKTATGDNGSAQNLNAEPTSYTSTPRATDFNDFKIDDRTNSMMVYNSDQLYYAIQNGAKPTFPDGDSPAKLAYERAKSILREICDDEMTEYQKTLAIFDWLCYNVSYDHNLLDLTNVETTQELYNYRGFYIEGVLFDKGQAVCDGIGKVFALFCGIENIECYKVTGTVENEGHAWNKVALDLNGDTVKEWYAVDATWSDLVGANDNIETLRHKFFLVTDNFLIENKHTETHPNAHTANTTFNYYANTLYDGTNDLYIQTAQEFVALLEYVKANNLNSIEFEYVVSNDNILYYIGQCGMESLGYQLMREDGTHIYILCK